MKIQRYLVLLSIVIVLALLPVFLRDSMLNLMIFAFITMIMAFGLSLLFGFGGQISIGQAGLYGLGAYISAYLSARLGLSPFVSVIFATIVPALLAYLIGRPILRLKGYYLAMVTAGMGLILHVAFVELEPFTGGYSGIPGIPPFRVGSYTLSSTIGSYYVIGMCSLAILLLMLTIVDTPYGRAMRIMRESEPAARSVGIDVSAMKAEIFAISAGLSGFAGSLYAHYVGYISPDSFTLEASINLLLALVVGGVSSIWGAAIGALILTFLPEWFSLMQNAYGLVLGIFVVVLLTIEPQGLVGLASRLWRVFHPAPAEA